MWQAGSVVGISRLLGESGHSTEPILPDGCSVRTQSPSPAGALDQRTRANGGLIVKRASKDGQVWESFSDRPAVLGSGGWRTRG